VLQSLEVATNAVLTHLKGDGGVDAVVFGDAMIGGRVTADGQGYPVGADPGPGAGGSGSWAGVARATVATDTSANPAHPAVSPTVRRSSPQLPAVRVVPVTLDRAPMAGRGAAHCRRRAHRGRQHHGPGARRAADNAGGGSGGSILLNTRTLAGAGEIRADGGPGEWVEGGSGAGGRIAIYRSTTTFTGPITASGGSSARPGGAGTVYESSLSTVVWLAPGDPWLFGPVPIEVAVFVSGTGPFTAEFSAWRDGTAVPIATVPAILTAGTTWDTTRVADGAYELRARILDASGSVVAESTRDAAVNNNVIWHNGALADSASWGPGKVHVVSRELSIGPGRTLTLEPG